MWFHEKVMRPLSMAHNVLEISGLRGLALLTDHGVTRPETPFEFSHPQSESSFILIEPFLDSICRLGNAGKCGSVGPSFRPMIREDIHQEVFNGPQRRLT